MTFSNLFLNNGLAFQVFSEVFRQLAVTKSVEIQLFLIAYVSNKLQLNLVNCLLICVVLIV